MVGLPFWPVPGRLFEWLLAAHLGFAEILDQFDGAGGDFRLLRRMMPCYFLVQGPVPAPSEAGVAIRSR